MYRYLGLFVVGLLAGYLWGLSDTVAPYLEGHHAWIHQAQ